MGRVRRAPPSRHWLLTSPEAPLGGQGDDRALIGALVEAQERRFLGPGPVIEHVEHARRLVPSLPETGVGVDLGSGGGVPGLVLAADRPGMSWVFVEANLRRTEWLQEALGWVGLGNVTIRNERAEETGRSELRGTAAVVTARSFAAPAITAECGAPLLGPGGVLWVSEPPSPAADRWPAAGLREVGLRVAVRSGVRSWAALEVSSPCPDRYPRRVGIPVKRPLF